VLLEDRGGELLSLKETRFVTVRAGLVGDLDAMDAAGIALRWARHLLPARHAEPLAWETLVRLLDALDGQRLHPAGPRALLAMAGFHLLASVGYALELERCVICGKVCPAGAPAFVDAARGGLVCRSCGGGGRRLDGQVRELAARAQRAEEETQSENSTGDWLSPPDWLVLSQANDLLVVLDDAMAAHTGLDPSK
jgi:DNA repair protein RecO (recombination protein O)